MSDRCRYCGRRFSEESLCPARTSRLQALPCERDAGPAPQLLRSCAAAYELRWLADMLDRGKVKRFTVRWNGEDDPEVVVILDGAE